MVESLARRCDGAVDIIGLRLGHLEKQVFRRGIDDIDAGGRRGFGPFAADKESVEMIV
jgi:hypothetical protein